MMADDFVEIAIFDETEGADGYDYGCKFYIGVPVPNIGDIVQGYDSDQDVIDPRMNRLTHRKYVRFEVVRREFHYEHDVEFMRSTCSVMLFGRRLGQKGA